MTKERQDSVASVAARSREVPQIVRAAGEAAIAAYITFLGSPRWSVSTQKVYRGQIERFLRWANAREFTLQTITPAACSAYAAEIELRSSPQAAMVALTGIRGLFRQLLTAAVIAENPFDPLTALSGHGGDEAKAAFPSSGPKKNQNDDHTHDQRFPLLALLAMLANMEEESRNTVLQREDLAVSLLEFVRWRDGTRTKSS